jgi:hypothetical protein
MATTFFITGSGQPAWTTAVAQGGPSYQFPLSPKDSTHVVIRQVYWVLRANYSRASSNSACPSDLKTGITSADAYFIDDTDFTPLVAGVLSFTRTWATVPATQTSYSTDVVRVPGKENGAYPQRNAYEVERKVKVVDTYTLVGTGTSYSDESTLNLSATAYTPSATRRALGNTDGALFGAINYITGTDPSTPSLTSYESAIATDAATATSYSYILKPAAPILYLGNIFSRRAIYVKAE